MDKQQPDTGWGFAGFSLGLLLLLILVLYRETTLFLGGLWAQGDDGGYGHGYLVLLVSCYLAYSKRESLMRLIPVPSIPALLVVAACSFVWMAAAVIDVQIVQVVVLLPLILSAVWVVAGRQVARELLLPVMYIGFAIPVWEPLLPVLQEITASAAFTLTRIAGIPALLQDYLVILPVGQLSIKPSCSGLHYLLAALALGFLYACLNYQGFWVRLLIVGTVGGIAILANILRVFIVIYLAYISDMRHPIVNDHYMLGWYLFGGLVTILLVVDHAIHRKRKPVHNVVHGQADIKVQVNHAPVYLWHTAILFAAAGLIALGPAVAWWADNRIVPEQSADLNLPQGIAGWHGPSLINDSWMPVFRGATELRRDYHKNDRHILLYVGLYRQQSQDNELINDLNQIYNPVAWQPVGPRGRTIMVDGHQIIERELVSEYGQHRVVWYLYRVAGRYTTSKYIAKILQVHGIITGRSRAAVIAIAADTGNDADSARQDMDGFLREMGPALARVIDGQVEVQGPGRQR